MREIPELVPLPAGEFWMGGEEDDKFVTDVERPRHRVMVSAGTSLGRFPVMEGELLGNRKKIPAVGICWEEAREFALWVGEQVGGRGRLATEAEWEWAARAGQTVARTRNAEEANFLYSEDGEKVGAGALSEVGRYALNEFGYGDLFGNVLEWVEDCWRPSYEGAPEDGSAWVGSGDRKVVRGGAWDHLPRLLRASWRDGMRADARQDNLGFRVAVDFRK
ncbi:formylglycine-generating enzyme family protein [Roseibacillus persicicus]|uniref:formylglycine-generating enzyme family protein n=1 Tax=Roseibacillus persicicus TaxID=454148 RepID=UPI0028100049|nr:SUMF1/EgtB/PvdO family nonheme iron enzyme [Roseibacillus persicicus]MDQ8191541.1 SUMF1/EgtB/PvdO family nonheme iron enzyme [Roseibacillus persicicus]